MLVQYDDKCIGQRKVYEWVERFKNGRTNVTGEESYYILKWSILAV
jgi:hypothetical protein